jgi:hypothetical protein
VDARAYVLANREGKGCICPSCDRFIRVYRRNISGPVAVWLIDLVRKWLVEQRPYHIRELPKTPSRGEEAKLRYWDLARWEINEDGKKTHSGLWQPTSRGIAFAHGNLRVPRHALVLVRVCIGMADENDLVDIKDCLKEQFDYEELMSR